MSDVIITEGQTEGLEPLPAEAEYEEHFDGEGFPTHHCSLCGASKASHIPGPNYTGQHCAVWIHPDIAELLPVTAE